MSSTTAAALPPHEIILQSSLVNKITDLILTDRRFAGHMGGILSHASTFKKESGIDFTAARIVGVARDLKSSDFNPGSSLQLCKRYACVSKYFSTFLELLSVTTKEDSHVYEIPDLDYKTSLSSSIERGLMYLRSASALLKNDKRLKENLPAKDFHMAAKSYIDVQQLFFVSIQDAPGSTFAERYFDDFMGTDILIPEFQGLPLVPHFTME